MRGDERTEPRPDAGAYEAAGPEAAIEAATDASPATSGCAADAVVLPLYELNYTVSWNATTPGPICVTYMGAVQGWQTTGTINRTVTVTGRSVQTYTLTSDNTNGSPSYGGMLPGLDGYIYWNFSASNGPAAPGAMWLF
jgi:hypothetical protein